MKTLRSYLKDYALESVLGPLFKLIEASFELMVPLVVASMVDQGIRGGETGVIARMGLALAGLALAGLVCSLTAQYFAARAAVGTAGAIRRDLFKTIQSLEYPQLDRLGTSGMITRMTSDVQQVQLGINLTLRLFLRSPFIVFGAMIMAFTVDARAAWVFAVAIPFLGLTVFGVMALTMPLYKKVQEALDQVTGKTRENLKGVRVVRAFAREDTETQEFDRRNEALLAFQKMAGRISALTNPVTYVILNGALIVLIYSGAWRVEGGFITQGALIALVNYMSQILVELVKLANLIVNMTRSAACWQRIRDMMAVETEKTDGQATKGIEDQPALVFEDVSFTYPAAGAPSLEHISFTLARGGTLGIIGGTGSGKSTLIQLIPGFYAPSSGQIRVEGIAISEWKRQALRDRIGMTAQNSALFSGTIRDNMRWGREDASDEEITLALRQAQAWSFVSEKEGMLDYQIEIGGRNLSGGQRQRLTIARALVRNPDILILDDSASGLDFATEAALRSALRELPKTTARVIVSQRAASIRWADQILVLDDGKTAGVGTHEQLMESCEVYREIYFSQFPKEDARK